jgi:hypothetical protein
MEIPDRIKNKKFEKLEGKHIVIIRTGIGLGGSTFSDLGNIKMMLEWGSKVTLATGFISEEARHQCDSINNLNIIQIPEIDRRYNFPNRNNPIEAIKEAIKHVIRDVDMVFFTTIFWRCSIIFRGACKSWRLNTSWN